MRPNDALAGFVLLVFAAACGEASSVAAGAEGGPCYGNGTCNDGLSCSTSVCKRSSRDAGSDGGAGGGDGTGTAGTSGASTGSGGATSGGATGSGGSGTSSGGTAAGGGAGIGDAGEGDAGTGCDPATCSGTCQASGCAVNLLTPGSRGSPAPPFIAQDDQNLYFSIYGSGIFAISKAGGPFLIVPGTTPGGFQSIVPDSGNLYVGSGGVGVIPLTGGTIKLLADVNSGPAYVTVQSGVVYYASINGVFSIPATGGTPKTLSGDGVPVPSTIQVDGTYVYWIGKPTQNTTAVERVPLGGGTSAAVAKQGQFGPIVTFAVDTQNAYFTDEGFVMKTPLAGGTVETLASAQFGQVSQEQPSVQVDGGNVYFTTASSVCKVPVGGGAVVTLATGTSAGVLAVDATSVYYWKDGPVKLTPK